MQGLLLAIYHPLTFQIDFRPEGVRELLLVAEALQADKVVGREMLAQRGVITAAHRETKMNSHNSSDMAGIHSIQPVVLLYPVGITEMAVEVLPPEVSEQLVAVDEPLLAELADRMSAMGSVVGVSLAPMRGQLGPGVEAALVGEILYKECKIGVHNR